MHDHQPIRDEDGTERCPRCGARVVRDRLDVTTMESYARTGGRTYMDVWRCPQEYAHE